MTRSFMLAVSGFALLSAACSPDNDADLYETDTDGDTAVLTDDTVTGNDTGNTSMDSLRDDLVDDSETMNDDALADEVTDGDMANFGLDYAGLWGTQAQCEEGRTYAFSASTITTPDGQVCSVTGLEEGAGQVELTGECTGEDGVTSEHTYLLAMLDDGSLMISDTTEVMVARCSSFETAPEPVNEDPDMEE